MLSRDEALRAVCAEMRSAKGMVIRGATVRGEHIVAWAAQIEAALALREECERVLQSDAWQRWQRGETGWAEVARLQAEVLRLRFSPAEREALEVALYHTDTGAKVGKRAEAAAVLRAMLAERSANE